MSIHQDVSSLNKMGVDLLNAGRLMEASATLQRALGLLQDAVGADEEPGTSNLCIPASSRTARGIGVSNTSNWNTVYQSRTVIPGLHDTRFFTYNHGILISSSFEEDTVDNQNTNASDETFIRYSSVVLFNLALVLHHFGMVGETRFRVKASILYTRCVQVVSMASFAVPEDEAHSGVLAVLALNNLAQLHHEQDDYTTSSNYLNQVSDMLQSIGSLGGSRILSQSDAEEIHLNIILTQQSPTAAKAA